jgi:hypothetical protein
MRFIFDEVKATQAAAYLLKKAGGREYLLKLMKLLYLSDRQALIEGGYPITGDQMFSLPKGPVLSTILDLVNGGVAPTDDSPWCRAIAEEGEARILKLVQDPGDDDLSPFEINIMDRIFDLYGSVDRFDLVELLHKSLPEFTDPGGSSCPIDPTEILRSAGFDSAEIRGMVQDAEDRRAMKVASASR